VGLEQAFTINPAHGLALDLVWRREFGVDTTEGKFGWNWYW
jgi:hypothetical protein